MSNSPNILFQLSGSIACYKACDVISQLVKTGCNVQVVCTASALKFVGEATLEGLTGRKVLWDTYESGEMMGHIDWARWCDLAILCPATANTINKLAAGIADDLIGTLFLAMEPEIPYLISPAMNGQMFKHTTVQASLEKLKGLGCEILPTDIGPLACGEYGPGRLLEPQIIMNAITHSLNSKSKPKNSKEDSKLQKVLITSGGTREPIDSVRYVTNFSTGRTGAFLADKLSRSGFDVTFLGAHLAKKPVLVSQQIEFDSFKDLDSRLQSLLSREDFHAIVHLAAVSDFSVNAIIQDGEVVAPAENNKLSSSKDLTVQLEKNFKIVENLVEYSRNKDIKVIAFKLTDTDDKQIQASAVKNLLENPNIHYVVHNDLSDIDKSQHRFTIHQDSGPLVSGNNKVELANKIEEMIL